MLVRPKNIFLYSLTTHFDIYIAIAEKLSQRFHQGKIGEIKYKLSKSTFFRKKKKNLHQPAF